MRINEEVIQRRLKGYIRFPRAFVYLLMDKKITTGDFTFYYQLVCLARFDSRNPLYGVVEFTRTELATELCLGTKTVGDHIRKLIRFGLIFKREDYLQIHLYKELFTSPKDYTTLGNQRVMVNTLLSNNNSSLGTNRNEITTHNNELDCLNNPEEEHIYDMSLSSCKDDVGSFTDEDARSNKSWENK